MIKISTEKFPLGEAHLPKVPLVRWGSRSQLYLLLVALAALLGFVGTLPTPALAQAPPFNLDSVASFGLMNGNSVAWGDYDNDGDLDILVAGYRNPLNPMTISAVYRNDGGSFTYLDAGLVGLGTGSVDWGDYDNDGDLDILLTGLNSDYIPMSKIYRNDGGSFTDSNIGLMGIFAGSATWGDYDNDGDLDILLNGRGVNGPITQVYQNNAGVFAAISADLEEVQNGSATWGDYDNDGDLDILLAGQVNYGGGPMMITALYQNNGGSFSYINSGLVGLGNKPTLAWGDYDNDGDLDLLLAGNTATGGSFTLLAEIYRNDGGSFTDTNAGLPAVGSGSAVWGDYDNDGDLDILLTGTSYSGGSFTQLTKIYRNDGGSFIDTNASLPGVGYGAAAWGDYDNDNDLDILLTGDGIPSGTTQIYRNDLPTANSQPAAPTGLTTLVSGTTVNLAWDTATDSQTPSAGLTYNLRVGHTPGGVNTLAPMADGASGYRRIPWLGNAQHGLTATLTLPAGTYYWSVQAVDTALAGSPFAAEQSFTITHTLTPPAAVTIAGPPAGQASFTYNFTATVTPVTTTLPISYAWNFGDGVTKFGPASAVTHTWATGGLYTVTVAAVNEGGLVVGTYPVMIASAFTDINAGLIGLKWGAAAWGDYDNDGDLDILMTGFDSSSTRLTKIYRNDGSSFADANAGLPGFHDGSAAWGDYDNDGDLDILLTGSGPSLRTSRVYRNDGGSFTDANAGLPGINDGAAAWGDYDNDGDLDILLAGWLNSGGRITRIYRNDGGTFTDANAGLANIAHSAVAWGDYDNDGDLDIFMSGYGLSQNDAKIYRNDGGSFTDTHAGLLNLIRSSAAWGDYDNDGDLDLLLAGTTDTGNSTALTKLYRKDGGSFTDTNAGLPGLTESGVAWGDYDNDGDLDILLASGDGPVFAARVYRNDGGIFAAVNFSLLGVGPSAAAWGDYDNDNDLDLLLTGLSGPNSVARIYRNDLPMANTPPAAPTGLTTLVSGTTVNLAWTAATDSQTPSDGLTYNLRVGHTPGAANVLAPMANGTTGYRRIPWLGNAQLGPTATLTLPVGTYYWSVQAIDTAFTGSPFAAEQSFTVIQPPTVLTLTGPTTGQVGFTYNFTATVTPATSGLPFTYTWQADGHELVTYTDGLSNSVPFAWATAGTKTITVTATNAGGTISKTTTVTITEVAITGLTASNSSPTELGQATSLTATVTGGSNISYTWAFGDGSFGSGAAPSHLYPAMGVYTAVVTASNSVSAITAPTTIAVTITDLPITGLTASNSSPTGLGQATSLTATVTGGSNISYTWAFGDGSFGSGATPGHLYPAVGVYTAVVTASNSVSAITTSITITVTGTPILTISKSGPAQAESGETILYTLTVTNSGNDTATGLVITDIIPIGATYLSGGTRAGNLVSWTRGSLPPNQSLQVQFAVIATTSITNSNYGVRTAAGYVVLGSQTVKTKVDNKSLLPIITK